MRFFEDKNTPYVRGGPGDMCGEGSLEGPNDGDAGCFGCDGCEECEFDAA